MGTLHVKCIRGVDLKAGQGLFGEADPYAKLRIGAHEFSTKSKSGGGKNPDWNEGFTFDISHEQEIEIEVLDKENVGGDKFMGRCVLSILEWVSNEFFENSFEPELLDKTGKIVGRIARSIKYERLTTGVADDIV